MIKKKIAIIANKIRKSTQYKIAIPKKQADTLKITKENVTVTSKLHKNKIVITIQKKNN